MYTKILVPVDGSATSTRGLNEAVALAKVHGAQLRLLHVVDLYPLLLQAAGGGTGFGQLRDVMHREGEAALEAGRSSAAAAGVAAEPVLRETQGVRVARTIVEECENSGCDLIVMGTHGRRGFNRLVVGSDAEAVMRTSPVPLLLVRGQSEPED